MQPQPLSSVIPGALANVTTTLASKTSEADWQPTIDAYEPSLRAARAACAKYAADMRDKAEPYWLTISGVAGSGKTMLARQLWEQAKNYNPGDLIRVWIPSAQRGQMEDCDRRPERVWIPADRFARRLLGGEFDLPEELERDYLVVYDDLGAARDKSDFLADSLYRFCNHRLGRWTIFTTNLTIPEISARIDERISSRLLRDNNRLVTIEAGDYALRRLAKEASA